MIDTRLFTPKRKKLVTISKDKCNQTDIKLSELKMYEINSDIAVPYISKKHYSKSCPRTFFTAFGFYLKDKMVGCIVYATPVNSFVSASISDEFELSRDSVLMLSRMFVDDSLPNNAESYCIARTIRHIRQKYEDILYLVAYADMLYGHCGIVFQASNWIYTGKVGMRPLFIYGGRSYHSRTMYEQYGTSSISKLREMLGDDLKVENSLCKFRYVYPMGRTKHMHNLLINGLAYSQLPYPKMELSYYRLE